MAVCDAYHTHNQIEYMNPKSSRNHARTLKQYRTEKRRMNTVQHLLITAVALVGLNTVSGELGAC